jgi:hypothetical protein
MAKLLTGTRIYGTGTVDTQLLVNGTEQANSTATGALEVVGGVGIGGSLFVGGIVTATNLVRLTNTTEASTTNTGALTVAGGVGVGKDLRVGGTIYGTIVGTVVGTITSATNIANGTVGQVPFQEAPGITKFFGPGTAGQLLVSAGASSTGPVYTTTSSIYVRRSGIADDLSGGAAGSIPYQDGANSTTFLGLGTAGFVMLAGVSAPVWVSTSTLVVGKAAQSDSILMSNNVADTAVNYLTFVSTTTGYTSLRGSAMSGIVYRPSTGDLGIGTGNPLYKLHISESTDKIAARIDRSTGGDVLQLYNQSGVTTTSTQLAFLHRDSASSAIVASRILGYATSLAAGAVSGGLIFNVSNAGTMSEAVRIDPLGNFGLGNAAPAYRLDVTGGARITGITTITNATAAISVSSGALQVTGGAGIGGNLYVGGTIFGTFNGAITGSASTASTLLTITRSTNAEHFLTFVDSDNVSPTAEAFYTSANISINPSTGALRVGGPILHVNGNYDTLAATYNLINTTATTVNFAGAATALTIGASTGLTTVRNNLTVAGNLTVQGTTTQVNSTVTNVSDPIFTIGTGPLGADPVADDNRDRGIAFKWHNGTVAKTGFFGYDDSTGFMSFVPDATLANEEVSGTKGAMDVNLAGGTAQSLVYNSAANTTAFLAAGTAGNILQTNGTGSAPSWVSPSTLSAGIADQVKTIAATANTAHFLAFVDSNNASATAETVYTTSSFVVNPSTGIVGVGVTPSAWFSAYKALEIGNTAAIFGSTPGFMELALTLNSFRSSSTGNWVYRNNGVASRYFQDGAGAHSWDIASSGTAGNAITFTREMTLDASGNLGVGTTSPTFTGGSGLEIQRTGTATLRLDSATFATEFRAQTNGTEIYQLSTGYLDLGTNATTRIRITSAGAVGIGTLLPTQNLDVTGGVAVTGVTELSLQRPVIPSVAGQGAPALQWKFYSAGTTYTAGAMIQGLSDAAWSSTSAPTSLRFYTVPTGSITLAERLCITATGAIAFNGATNYGSTGQFLQSNGDAPPTWASASSLAAGQVSTITRSTNATHYLTFVDSDNVGATAESVYTNSSFVVNPGTGNIGIGTLTPGYKTHIVGAQATGTTGFGVRTWNQVPPTVYLQSTTAAIGSGGTIGFGARDSAATDYANWRIRSVFSAQGGGFGANLGLLFDAVTDNTGTSNLTNVMALLGSGNVGIGTIAPSTRLTVQAAGANGIALLQDTGTTTNSGRLFFQASGGTYGITNVGNVLQFSSGATIGSDTGTARMVLNSSGFLGVGTTQVPLTYLDVRHNNSSALASQVSGFTLRTNENNGMEWHLQHSNGYTGWVAAARVNNNGASFGQGFLEFITAGSSGGNQVSVMALHGNGNVSIGSTAVPTYKLFVNGSFAATTKSFVIDHPTKPDHKLRYGSLEGPENGVYVRGRLKDNNVIELPDYWTGLVDEDSITVDLTPVGKHQKLYVEDIANNTVTVGTKSDQPINCFYTVWAERKDVDKLVVEYKEQEI